jgi:ElaB/YqjD/DUF883 family membrane-anchored ribosome-binding protein
MNKNGMTDVGSTAGSTRGVDEKIDSLKDTVRGLADQGAQKVDALKSKAVEVKDEALSRGGALLDRTCSMIQAHPLKSVGIAFAAGYFGMRLFRR